MAGMRRTARALAPFVVLLVVLGLADSVISSFVVLYFTTDAHLTALQTGIAISVATLSGIAVTTLTGRSLDRRVSRWPLIGTLLVSAAGFVALALVDGFLPILLVVIVTGVSAAGFPQAFALERSSTASVDPATATGALRSGWSFAWAVGPLAASVVVAVAGYHWLFVLSAILLVAGAAVTGALRLRPTGGAVEPGAADRERRPARPGVRLTVAAIAVFHLAMFVGSFALPLLLTGPAAAAPAWVGIAFGACAFIEVPAAFLAARLLKRRSTAVLLVACSALFALYFVVIAAAPVTGVIIAAQAIRGVALAVMGIAGIEALRDLMAPRLAAATAAFANALAVGSLLAGISAGALVQLTGSRATTLVAAGLAGVAGVLLLVARVRRTRAEARAEEPVASPPGGRAAGVNSG